MASCCSSQITDKKSIWTYIGAGNFNEVYVDNRRLYAKKVVINPFPTDKPEHAVRTWNAINPDLKLRAIVWNDKSWVCPYIEGTTPSDSVIASTLIDIYNRTRHIVLDAYNPGNFILSKDGKCICVDVGLALKFSDKPHLPELLKQPCIASDQAWKEIGTDIVKHFKSAKKNHPLTTEVIQALLFLTNHYPGIINTNFLIENPKLRNQLIEFSDHFYDSLTYVQWITKNILKTIEQDQLCRPFDCQVSRYSLFSYDDIKTLIPSYQTPTCSL